MEDEKEVMINSTKSQIKDFIENSIIWQDIKRELETWKEIAKGDYSGIIAECIEKGTDGSMSLGDVHGREKAIDYFLLIPEMFIQILEDKEQEEKQDGTRRK